jgi:hypothetical protein
MQEVMHSWGADSAPRSSTIHRMLGYGAWRRKKKEEEAAADANNNNNQSL